MEQLQDTDIFSGLNSKQKEAVETINGPLLILAGAGSGKTKVLTHRIANLLRLGIPTWNILAITFTNKAAREMKERISKLVGPKAEDIWISTFHSMCVRILRRDIHHLGYSKQFTILDSGDQLSVVKQIMKELNIDVKKFEPKAILASISNAKNELKTPEVFGKTVGDFFQQKVLDVYERYQARLKMNNSLDFDDLIMSTVHLFQNVPEVLEFYQKKFQYIHIDEYQDTNRAQYMLVRMLADYHQNICVVGDTDQSIYKWRGADISNILNFEEDFPKAQVIKLEQNYRSTKNIIQAANSVIKNNRQRKEKNLWTENPKGNLIAIYRANNEHDEANFISDKIQEQIKNGKRYIDFAVLYRTNAQSRVIEEAFLKANIPYKMVGGTKFYDRKEIKDILAYLRLIYNPDDDMSLRRVINVPKRGIGAATIDKIAEYANSHSISMYSAIGVVDFIGLTARTANKVSQFRDMIEKFRQLEKSLTVTELTEKVIEDTKFLEEFKKEKSLEAESRIENIKEFLSVTIEFEKQDDDKSLENFLSEVALVSDIDQADGDTEQVDSVTMMTLHSAKGLEFPVVFLAGLEEGIFPHNRALMEEDEMEEERRLAYVGITRAEQELYISYADSRMLFGRTQMNKPSRFISEIPEELLLDLREEVKKTMVVKKRNILDTKKNIAPRDDWSVGDKVRHTKWGVGVIVSTKNSGDDLELQIAFSQPTGIKNLLARFAPIEKVD
ncbi:ATP-dependent DNA helicase PcrA [Vulcanibacillus modesticaldus]|uniref:ATP-dependent DNA helicase n=1 Tax=Vulcanibacillus modesticaldus TaxID=337097 RepID=A0A1D2YUY6_9BACI|nr:DNA helicase PcrA [Vulcanibacillus modesticaldus]OEF99465.1 ATP-dependent DNA helicase PcrA [Vulcanibacillus modesticaldus]